MGEAVVPNPGSEAARLLGCLCPVLDNEHGAGWMGMGDDGLFVISERCPIHAEPGEWENDRDAA